MLHHGQVLTSNIQENSQDNIVKPLIRRTKNTTENNNNKFIHTIATQHPLFDSETHSIYESSFRSVPFRSRTEESKSN